MNDTEEKYYVYIWYFKDTNVVFILAKANGKRYLDRKSRRNQYFKNIINKYHDNVDVKKYAENLLEKDAYDLEKQLINEYWAKGECKANFHEGGCGGNTGNYDSPERSRKISEFAKTRTGDKNPMWHHVYTEETRRKIGAAQKGKKLSEEHIKKIKEANIGRKKTQEEILKLSLNNKGKHFKSLNPEAYEKMMDHDCPYHYYVELNGETIFDNISSEKMEKFCETTLNISRTIIYKCINSGWTPKFKRHQHLKTLKIYRVKRSVSTNPDECKGVESEISADPKCTTTK